MNTKIVVDLTQTLGSSLKFKGAVPKKEYGGEKIIGTSISVLDKNGNEQVVSIYKLVADIPALNKLKPFDEVRFDGLEGFVRGSSKQDSTFVTLKLVLKAENLREGRTING